VPTSNNPIKLAVMAVVAAVTLAGCATPDPAETSSPPPAVSEPHVTLSAPETVNVKAPLALVIDSSGHDGEQVKLYAFPAEFDAVSDCSDISVTPTPIVLTGGAQKITLNAVQTGGDMYWVVSGEGFTTQCGDSKTRFLNDPVVAIASSSSGAWSWDHSSVTTAVIERSDPGVYGLIGRFPPVVLKELSPVTVTWVGPFATAPEANASPCPVAPVAATDQFSIDQLAKGEEDATEWPVVYHSSSLPTPVSEPGIYRILVEAPATDYTFAQPVDCESALLVTVR
jgi:hypothetical protein